MTEGPDIDRQFRIAMAGGLIILVIGSALALWLGAGFWVTVLVAAGGFVVGIYAATFWVV